MQEQNKLKEILSQMTQKDLIEKLLDLAPQIKSHYENKNSWEGLPFIPEDCGFEGKEVKSTGAPTRTVYYRDGVSCVKTEKSSWIVCKGEEDRATVHLPNKFEAFHFFKAIGIEFDYSKTTVPDTVLMSVEEILEKGKESNGTKKQEI